MSKSTKPTKRTPKRATRIKAFKPDTSKLLVKIIEDDSINLATSLGITKENIDRLVKIGEASLEKSQKTSVAMMEVSKACTHANELAYVMYAMGYSSQSVHQDPFLSFIEELKKSGYERRLRNPDDDQS